MKVNEILKNCLQEYGLHRNFYIAYSGGRDSHVLLHALALLRKETHFNFKAIHINHSLSANADSWANHCKQICFKLKVEMIQLTVNAKSTIGESPEEVAREKRYAALAAQLSADDILLTAHHQDDQAETFLLQLMRGAGTKGLAAMPYSKPLGNGYQVRPFLTITRAEIIEYALENNLHWIEDESNQQLHFSRNFIRSKIIPVLQERWPNVTTTIARSAEHCSEAQQLIDSIAAQDYAVVAGTVANTLSVPALLKLTKERQRQVIRYWLQQNNFPLPSSVKLHQAQLDMLHAREDKVPVVNWQGAELRRFRNDLYVIKPLSVHDTTQIISWDLSQPLNLQNLGTLQATPIIGEGLRADIPDITIRFRTGGELCQLPGRAFRHDLKKLLQSWNIPVWQRDRIPLIYSGDKLAAAVGLFVDSQFIPKENETGYLLAITAP
jgi:tRNA(Ile)-lysidine synthase